MISVGNQPLHKIIIEHHQNDNQYRKQKVDIQPSGASKQKTQDDLGRLNNKKSDK